MLLKYRGISYEYNPPQVEMEPSSLVGRYRGLEWRFRTPKSSNVQQPTLNLVYRGVPYQTGNTAPETEPVETATATQKQAPGSSVQDLARGLLMGHHKRVHSRQQAMLARANAEIGMDTNTEDYWFPIQGKVRSQNWSTYDRSSVAMS